MKHILELSEFFVEGRHRQRSHVLLHITEPSTPEERKKGYFFALVEIEYAAPSQIEHIQKMIDDLESGYYETEDEEDKDAFEVTLEYINRRGHHVLEWEGSRVHAIVGTMRQGAISFATHGTPIGQVLYKTKQGYQTMSVVEDEEQHDDNLFSAMMKGAIQPNDYFFIATPHVAEYLSSDRLSKIITSRPAAESVSHIQKVLTNLRSEESFGGLVFHLISKDQLPKTGKMPAHLKAGSADSLQKLISSQQQTTETLYPPVMQRAASFLGKYVKGDTPVEEEDEHVPQKKTRVRETHHPSHETNHRSREPEQQVSFFNTLLIEFGKLLVISVKFLGLALTRAALACRDGIVFLFVIATNTKGQRQHALNQVRKIVDRRRQSFQAMPTLSKVLFVSTIIFALVFIGSIVYLKAKEAADARQAAIQQQIAAITDKQDAAEASMIYGDDEKAFTLLKEAETLLDDLATQDTGNSELAGIRTSLEGALMQLRNITVVTPDILATVSSTNPAAAVTRIGSRGNTIIAYGPRDTQAYLINKSTGSIEQRDHTALTGLRNDSTPKEDDLTVFVRDENQLATFDGQGNFSASDISFPPTADTITDLFVYNRRIYSLSPTDQQVYRHNPIATGYDRGTPWITSRTSDISTARGLAIDGDIYVLTEDGVTVFSQGEEVSFSLRGLDPALDNPTEIWTYNDTETLYILEPTNKRILLFTKEGQLIKQITAESWQAPSSMVVDEESNAIFVLDSGVVYRVGL